MKKKIIFIIIVILCISAIAFTDLVIRPGYLIKTMVKAPIFLITPILYALFYKNYDFYKILKISKKGIKNSLLLGIGLYTIIVGFFLLISNFIDLEPIITSLENNLGINKNNFIYIALYVCLINSFLEEWFFRGFMYNELKKYSVKTAYIISSIAFSVYHVAIMDGMFNIYLFILIMISLFIGGLIFCYLNQKNNNIYSSWCTHAFANFAMNTIGFILFF